jgi:hypothetical protein
MPTRDEIKDQVTQEIAVVTDTPADQILESDKLFEKLGMGPMERKAMALPYTKIAESYPGGLSIGISEAEQLETVRESINLVTKRAQGKP